MAHLEFKGKTFVRNHHLLVKYHALTPVKTKGLSPKPSLEDNLIVHGDNLKALKALLPMYSGRVKCVYIDPPYNTGNEKWVYNDNVNSPMMQEWLGKVVDREDLTRHDKWLCMMMPRLTLLKELMSDDGAIFISIDDNEVHRLRMLMDEIFGETHFVANIVWQKKYASSNDHQGIAPMHDHILVYQKTDAFVRNYLPRSVVADDQYRYEDDKGTFRVSDYTCNKSAEERPNLYYAIINPNTGEKIFPKRTRVWAYSKQVYESHFEQDLIWWGKDGKASVPGYKRYRDMLRSGGGLVPSTWWDYEFAGHTDEAKKEFRRLVQMKDSSEFETIKPVALIRRVLQVSTGKDSIILDSFAGSGTTAHAVLKQNKEDGGNRRFILVECEDYADSLTAERVRRVIKGVPKAKDKSLRKGLGGSFGFFKLGKPIELHSILEGDGLPSYDDLARYVFYTATGEEFDPSKTDRKTGFIGENAQYQVYLFYEPDPSVLRELALTLEMARGLPRRKKGKRRLVFAPAKYMAAEHLDYHKIDFAQLPFEIYERAH